MQEFEKLIGQLSDFVWGQPLLILLLGTHIFLTFRLRFIQRYLEGDQTVRSEVSRRSR